MDLKSFIRDVPDFPTPGILFRDITPLLKDPGAFRFTIDIMEQHARELKPTCIVGVESRGFYFATPIADRLKLPFVPIRKPGKLPHKPIDVEYSLEYGKGKLEMHADALTREDRALIVDDVLATGGTALGSVKLVEKLGAKVAGLVFLIELSFLKGREALSEYPARSLIDY